MQLLEQGERDMLKKCSNCNARISVSEFYKQYLFKNRFRYTCSECGTVHKANLISIIMYTIIFIVLYGYIIVKSTFSFSINVFLLLIYIFIFQPLILKYENKNK